MTPNTTRRGFLKTMGAAAITAPLFLPKSARAQGANDALNIAFVGTGGMGGAHCNEMQRLGQNCKCFCDVDTARWGGAKDKWPEAVGYQDYRVMFEKEADNIDAVMIGAPDHHHYAATILAMNLGKHVYTQKPLTQTCWEARALAGAAAAHPGIVTQMGNQGHAGDAWRVLYEFIKAGGIGDIQEIHTWTNRPVWPQGMDRPEGQDPVPDTLDWDVWLGGAPVRPFKDGAYHPFVWRGWIDFGAGALGDMACHTMDGMFWTMDPGYPTVIEPIVVNNLTKEAFPSSAVVKWTFPATADRPGFVQYWYEGGLKPQRPDDLEQGKEIPDTGSIWIGTEGKMVVPGDYGGGIWTIPEGRLAEVGEVPRLLERCPNEDNYAEWLNAIKGEDKTESNFGYAGPMTETILLGNIATVLGQPIEYDGPNMKIKNIPEANAMLNRQYREGWSF